MSKKVCGLCRRKVVRENAWKEQTVCSECGMGIRAPVYVERDGQRLQVARPSDPAKALRIAREAAEKNDAERLANLMNEVGADTYEIIGYLGRDERIFDKAGQPIDRLRAGDSMVTPLS